MSSINTTQSSLPICHIQTTLNIIKMSKIFNSLFNSKSLSLHGDASLTKLFHVNNAPVNSFCNTVPILQPSLVSTPFGQSLICIVVLVVYFILYQLQSSRTGVESRLLVSLILGAVLFASLTFNDWFNLRNQIVLCNDYKNGILNLYQVSELIEKYRLLNFISVYKDVIISNMYRYSALAIRQFITEVKSLAFDGWREALDHIQKLRAK